MPEQDSDDNVSELHQKKKPVNEALRLAQQLADDLGISDFSLRENKLKLVRNFKRFETASDAARDLDLAVATYSSHENGSRGYRRHTSDIYADFFDVNADWLWSGNTLDHMFDQNRVKSGMRRGSNRHSNPLSEMSEHFDVTLNENGKIVDVIDSVENITQRNFKTYGFPAMGEFPNYLCKIRLDLPSDSSENRIIEFDVGFVDSTRTTALDGFCNISPLPEYEGRQYCVEIESTILPAGRHICVVSTIVGELNESGLFLFAIQGKLTLVHLEVSAEKSDNFDMLDQPSQSWKMHHNRNSEPFDIDLSGKEKLQNKLYGRVQSILLDTKRISAENLCL